MPQQEHWENAPDLWDELRLGGVTLPGAARVRVALRRKIDSRSAPGQNGARLIDKGADVAKLFVALTCDAEDWYNLSAVSWRATYRRERRRAYTSVTSDQDGNVRVETPPYVRPGDRAPVRIEHPKAAVYGIEWVYVASLTDDGPDAHGLMTVSLELHEYIPDAQRQGAVAAPRPQTQADPGALPVTQRFQNAPVPPSEAGAGEP